LADPAAVRSRAQRRRRLAQLLRRKIRRLYREASADGFTHFKLKVGADRADDVRRVAIMREEIGPSRSLIVDANQRWDVVQAIEWTRALASFKPLWIEESDLARRRA
jgi:L-fuconate dehydratase